MSGGAYNYSYHHLDSFIELLKEREIENTSNHRRLMIDITEEFRELAKTIEWVDSGDSDPLMADEAIAIFLNSMTQIGAK